MKILVGVLITLCLIWCIHSAHAETTTINPYKDEGRNAFIAPKSNLNETTCLGKHQHHNQQLLKVKIQHLG
jgi:hypothetical protein